ncbi:MAG: ABC transporter ATP-binding protein [Salinibacterium sp.]|nr:ABC transporter ATP-binding protein [Salinibacterium sp.]
MIVESFRVSPGDSVISLLETFSTIFLVLRPVLVGLIVTGIAARNPQLTVWSAIGLVVAAGLGEIFSAVGVGARVRLKENVGFAFDLETARLLSELPTIEHFHDPDVADRIRLIAEQNSTFGLGVNRLLNVLHNSFYVLGTIGVALTASPWMLLPLAAGALSLVIAPLIARWELRSENASAAPGRDREALLDAGADIHLLEDGRLHGGLALMGRRLDAAFTNWQEPRRYAAVRAALLSAAGEIIFFAAVAVAVVLMMADAFAGRIAPGAVAQGLLLVSNLAGLSIVTKFTITMLLGSVRSVSRFLWLTQFVADHRMTSLPSISTPLSPAHQPGDPGNDLVLKHVSYFYPGARTAAVDDISLRIPQGCLLLLVGENGSGKSTLVDLILGVRTPSSGTVRIPRGPDGSRARMSAVEQDFVRYQMTPRDNVGFGDIDRQPDPDRFPEWTIDAASRAAASAGGAVGFVEEMANGWNQQLGTGWPDGVEPSGGQWQRLALSRGFMRPDAAIVCFDEPGAALDPEAESAFLAQLRQRARAGQTHSARFAPTTISVFVTHRLDAVAHSDLVAVVDHGRLVEFGTPAELMQLGARFAHLWQLHRNQI